MKKKKIEENIKTGKKEKISKGLKAVSKSHPLFIEFRLWQFLRNLKIYHKQNKNNIDITLKFLNNDEQRCELFKFLIDKKEIDQKHILNYFVKQQIIEKIIINEYRWNFSEDSKVPINPTKAQFIFYFKKVKNFNFSKLTLDFQIKLWHIIYSVKDKNQFERALKTFAKKNEIDQLSFVENFKKTPSYKS